MKVNVHEVTLVVNEKERRLTKAVAKQFPILDGGKRWRAGEEGEPQPEPICKVMGKTLGSPHCWLYLVQDEVAGLGWVAAMEPSEAFARAIVYHGGWVDIPANVPTAIL